MTWSPLDGTPPEEQQEPAIDVDGAHPDQHGG